MSNTFNALVEAVQASGKKFNEISKESILAFLERQGEPRKSWETTYQKLEEVFSPKKKSTNKSSSGNAGSPQMIESVVVDYTDNSHNDVKVRQPRKSIFSEIKKSGRLMKTLVTGGLGFVGSNLVDILVDLGDEVFVLDDLSSESSFMENHNEKANLIVGKVEDINKYFVGYKFDRIFHLAAKARIQPSFDNPAEYFSSNALGTSEVMEFARLSKSGIVVYATTSSKNHGDYISPYTYYKVVGEGILKTYANCFDMNCAMATFYNVYGSREPKIGEWATVVAKFGRQFEEGEQLTVVGDGLQSRDFTHVEDICNGLIKISEGDWRGQNFDLGRGNPVSILDVAKMWVDNDLSKIKFVPLRKNEGQHTESEWMKTYSLIKWRAEKNLSDYIKSCKILNLQ